MGHQSRSVITKRCSLITTSLSSRLKHNTTWTAILCPQVLAPQHFLFKLRRRCWVVDTDPGRAGNQTTLTFRAANWNVPQRVRVTVQESIVQHRTTSPSPIPHQQATALRGRAADLV